MKQTTKKIVSIALSFALALTLFAGAPIFAEGENPPVETGSTAQNQNISDQTDGNDDTNTDEPTPIPDAFISNYSVDVKDDSLLYPGGKMNLSITVVDEWADTHGVQLRARINSSAFAGKDAVVAYASADHGTHAYKFEFKDIEYLGGDNTFKFDIITENSSEARQIITLSLPINQCAERPEPTPAPTPAPAEVPKIMVKDFTFGGNSV